MCLAGETDPTIRVIRRSGRWKNKAVNGARHCEQADEEAVSEVNDHKTERAEDRILGTGNKNIKDRGETVEGFITTTL